MQIIPAIDIKDGHCVRLKQGEMQSAPVFSEDPAAMAQHWLEQGAKRLHLVNGDNREILPGIRAYIGARHTYASQYLRIDGDRPLPRT